SDEPLDLGTITVQVRPRARIGEPAPPVRARKLDGSTVQLSDFRGKSVLLYFIHAYPLQTPNAYQPFDATELKLILDRFGSGNRMAVLGIALDTPADQVAQYVKRNGINWPIGLVENWEKTLAPQYVNFPNWAYLIEPEGNVLGISPSSRATYTGLETTTLGQMRYRKPGVEVVTEAIAGQAASPPFAFKGIPSISSEDAGQRASFSIVDGKVSTLSGGPGKLNDGIGPLGSDDPQSNFFFEIGTLEGRLKADLGKLMPVAQINTYSWHAGARGPQLYRVYCSDGTAANFDPEPKIGIAPANCGWTPIAEVDTRPPGGGTGGQYGVSIRAADGAISNCRYLLFIMFVTETKDRIGHTFYSEIDVVERKPG
ncbi:MAG: redoxin domain-containing protein, partial [Planctomycetota bacterium]|nr:redoxin domain-containing protein [Planctomycetota bacterium]